VTKVRILQGPVEARRQRAADRIEHPAKREMAAEAETRLAPPAGLLEPAAHAEGDRLNRTFDADGGGRADETVGAETGPLPVTKQSWSNSSPQTMVSLSPSIRRQWLLSGPNEQTSLLGAPATAGDRNGTGVAAASSDETVCVWDAAKGRELAALQRNRRGLFSRLQRSWKAHRHSIGRPYPMGSRAPRRTGSRLQSGCGCSSAGQARGGAGPAD
jgi:hypothetical protein